MMSLPALRDDNLLPVDAAAPVRQRQSCVAMARILPQFEDDQSSAQFLDDVLEHRFSFAGESFDLGADIDWLGNPSRDVEWHILLHKFYYAPALARRYLQTGDKRYRACFEYLVSSWAKQTPPGYIATDVTARRVQNWVYAWSLFGPHDQTFFSQEFVSCFLSSLEAQTAYIVNNLAPSRNHRTLELYAVFLASVAIPELPKSAAWRAFAIREMLKNIETDLLPDGVHCELSTDYHHIVLRSYLLFFRLAKMNRISLPGAAGETIQRALDFALHIHRPDGDIPALSDADSRSYRYLLEWGADLFEREDYRFIASAGASGAPPSRQHAIFPHSGYTVLRSAWRNDEAFADARYLVFDTGPVGAGNHGHLDALNVEIAAYGKPLIVDPGRYTYDEQGVSNWRARFRATSAHNTVTVNGRDQAIYKQRGVKRRILQPHPEAGLAHCDLNPSCAYLHGYVSSPNYAAIHHRHIWFPDNRYWLIVDRIVAAETHDCALRFQLTPAAEGRSNLRAIPGGTVINAPGLLLMISQDRPSVVLESSFVSKLYGSKHAAPRICATAAGSAVTFVSLVYPWRDRMPGVQLLRHADGGSIHVMDRKRQDIWNWSDSCGTVALRSNASEQIWHITAVNDDG